MFSGRLKKAVRAGERRELLESRQALRHAIPFSSFLYTVCDTRTLWMS